jgi:hypothetical protein
MFITQKRDSIVRFKFDGYLCKMTKDDGSYFTCDQCGSEICSSPALYPSGHFYCCSECEVEGEGYYLIEADIWIVMP